MNVYLPSVQQTVAVLGVIESGVFQLSVLLIYVVWELLCSGLEVNIELQSFSVRLNSPTNFIRKLFLYSTHSVLLLTDICLRNYLFFFFLWPPLILKDINHLDKHVFIFSFSCLQRQMMFRKRLVGALFCFYTHHFYNQL